MPLNNGSNTFILQSGEQREIFVITKPVIKSSGFTPRVFSQYSSMKTVSVTVDEAPLRSSPVDAGVNRIAHLQRDIKLQADGEKDGFYRIVLGKDKYGWISKTNVKSESSNNFELAQLSGYEYVRVANRFRRGEISQKLAESAYAGVFFDPHLLKSIEDIGYIYEASMVDYLYEKGKPRAYILSSSDFKQFVFDLVNGNMEFIKWWGYFHTKYNAFIRRNKSVK